ncbi:MAG TPA: hypothetical protein VIG97_03345 [Luteimonas sp.]
MAMNLLDYALEQGGTGKIGCPVLARIATGAACSPATLYMISLGHKQASAKLAVAISKETGGQVSGHDLRPDIFGPDDTGAPAARLSPAADGRAAKGEEMVDTVAALRESA